MTAPATERPLELLLAAFAAGRLSEAFSALVAAHLELKAENREFVTDMEIAGGILLDNIEPVALSERARQVEQILAVPADAAQPPWNGRNWDAQADAGDGLLPRALRSYVGRDFSELEWQPVVPGLQRCTIAGDRNGEATIMRCRAGKRIPWPRHEGLEAALVLQGGLGDARRHLLRGDLAVAEEAIADQPVADPNEECIYFVAREGAMRGAEPVERAAHRAASG